MFSFARQQGPDSRRRSQGSDLRSKSQVPSLKIIWPVLSNLSLTPLIAVPMSHVPAFKSQISSPRSQASGASLVPGRRSHGPSSKPQAQAPSSDTRLKRFSASLPNPQGSDFKTHGQVSHCSALRSQVQVPGPGLRSKFLATKS